jgi:cobalt-zinc-cadmium efflux system protein
MAHSHAHAGHDHHHGHDHGHGHHHRHDDTGRVLAAFALTAGFMLVEVVGGVLSGSLALVADAGHMLTDAAALALSWFALRIAGRAPDPRRSYGYHRFQVLAAFTNGGVLIAVSLWIVLEAVQRLFAPEEVRGGLMLGVAAAGFFANAACFLILHGGNRDNLNIRGALLHVLSDLLGSAAAMVAAVVILLTGWTPIDPILSVLVALLILRSAWDLVGRSWHVLMEGTPEGFDPEELKRDLVTAVPGVEDVHHVHLWALTPERPLVTLHARIADGLDHDTALRRLQSRLGERFGLQHATIQVERGECAGHGPGGSCH